MIKLAVTLRGVKPYHSLPYVIGQQIVLVHGLTPMAVVMAGAYLSLSGLFWAHSPTLFGKAMALGFLIASLPLLLRIALSVLFPTARLNPGVVELSFMPFVTLRRRRFPARAFRLVLHPWHGSRIRGHRSRGRTETLYGWAFVLEHPGMLPIVLELRWQGDGPEELPDVDAAEARAEELVRALGLGCQAAVRNRRRGQSGRPTRRL
ncbi:MAG: hypothetical protein ACXIVG_13640 [Pararhodobacter sp.]